MTLCPIQVTFHCPMGSEPGVLFSLSGRACLVLSVTHQRPGEHLLGREYILGAMGDLGLEFLQGGVLGNVPWRLFIPLSATLPVQIGMAGTRAVYNHPTDMQ